MRLHDIPGPRGVSYYKTLLGLGDKFIQTTNTLFDTYGKVVGVYPPFGPHLRLVSVEPNCPGAVFAYGPDINRQIATHSEVFHKNPLLGGVHPYGNLSERQRKLSLWGTGLFAMNGDLHRQGRRLLMPGFHKNRLESYREDIIRLTNQRMNSWVRGDVINMHRELVELTGQIVVTTLFGSQDGDKALTTSAELHAFMLSMFSPAIRFLPFDRSGMAYHTMLNRVEQMDRDLRQIIANKRLQTAGANDLLSMLIEAQHDDGSLLTEDELIEQATVIFAAGHQTSSDAISWTLLLLAQHTDIAKSLMDELNAALKGEPPTMQQINDLPLLDRVVKESLRLVPPAPINGRVLSQPFELHDQTIPAGTEFLFSILHTQHMPDLYTNPKRFDPSRWEKINPSAYEYTPFSAGPRMCIGAPFAWMEIKLILAIMLQHVALEIPSNTSVNPVMTVTLGPDHLPMKVSALNALQKSPPSPLLGSIRELVALPN